MQKVKVKDIGGDVVKDNSTYKIQDNKLLKKLVVSSTFLRANQKTSGHSHEGQEEVYHFIQGEGEMEIDGNRFTIEAGDVILIEDGEYHRVYNTGHLGMYFICVFNGERSH
jgi:mannose-6-phosphate isomerase-like protein (cupin superfamily)